MELSLRRIAGAARRRLLGQARQRLGLPGPRDRLLDRLPRGGSIVEVGVWRGDFSDRLLRTLEPARLDLVDPWAFVPHYDKAWYGGSEATSQDDMDEIFEGVKRRFAPEIRSGRVAVHRSSSLLASRELASRTFDVVYIDGDHTYDAVRADLEAWAPLLAADGFLTGDDYGDGGWWQGGVKRAVDEFALQDAWQLTLLDTQFVFRRTDAVDRWSSR